MTGQSVRMEVVSAGAAFPSYLQHDGPYNVPPEEASAIAPWITGESLPSVGEAELSEVQSVVRAALRKHGAIDLVAPLYEVDFFVCTDHAFDRTIRVEVANYVRFWDAVVALLKDLSCCLEKWPLWRVMFDADADDDVIVVYPNGVRVDYEERASSVTDRVIGIAEARLRGWGRRERHRSQRRAELAAALPAAFEFLETSSDPAVLVRAFDTLSEPFSDRQNEGGEGTSLAILFRDDRDYHNWNYATDPPEEPFYAYWATPTGRLIQGATPSEDVPGVAKLMLVFEPATRSLTLSRAGKQWKFEAPRSQPITGTTSAAT